MSEITAPPYIKPDHRDKALCGTTVRTLVGCGRFYITLNVDDKYGRLFELFGQVGKSGGCICAQNEAICRLISLALRCNVDPASIVEQLKGIRCPNPSMENGVEYFSCADAIGKIIERVITGDIEIIDWRIHKDERTEKHKDESSSGMQTNNSGTPEQPAQETA